MVKLRRAWRWSVFQYPLMDRLYFGGAMLALRCWHCVAFQYPLMDRLYFGGAMLALRCWHCVAFQYPLMDRLYFGGCGGDSSALRCTASFSIL